MIATASAAIAYELTFSPLRRLLFLDREYPHVILFSTLKAYWRLFYPMMFMVLLPAVLTGILLCRIHIHLHKLVNCKYCLAFWIGLVIYISLALDMSTPYAIITGGIAILMQSFNNIFKRI